MLFFLYQTSSINLRFNEPRDFVWDHFSHHSIANFFFGGGSYSQNFHGKNILAFPKDWKINSLPFSPTSYIFWFYLSSLKTIDLPHASDPNLYHPWFPAQVGLKNHSERRGNQHQVWRLNPSSQRMPVCGWVLGWLTLPACHLLHSASCFLSKVQSS